MSVVHIDTTFFFRSGAFLKFLFVCLFVLGLSVERERPLVGKSGSQVM